MRTRSPSRAISTGVYGCPTEAATQVAVRTLRDVDAAGTPVSEVLLVAFDPATAELYERALGDDR